MGIVPRISLAVDQASASSRSSDLYPGSDLRISAVCDFLFSPLKLHFCLWILEVFRRKREPEVSRRSIGSPEGTPRTTSQHHRSVLAGLLRLWLCSALH